MSFFHAVWLRVIITCRNCFSKYKCTFSLIAASFNVYRLANKRRNPIGVQVKCVHQGLGKSLEVVCYITSIEMFRNTIINDSNIRLYFRVACTSNKKRPGWFLFSTQMKHFDIFFNGVAQYVNKKRDEEEIEREEIHSVLCSSNRKKMLSSEQNIFEPAVTGVKKGRYKNRCNSEFQTCFFSWLLVYGVRIQAAHLYT